MRSSHATGDCTIDAPFHANLNCLGAIASKFVTKTIFIFIDFLLHCYLVQLRIFWHQMLVRNPVKMFGEPRMREID